MATTYLFSTVARSTKYILRAVQKETCFALKRSPCVSLQQNLIISRTYAGFVNKLTAEDLWRSVTSVSNPGRKRGRARSLKKRTDLNRGQFLGVGKSKMVFPGLTGPAIMGTKHLEIHTSEKQEEKVITKPTLRRRFPRIPALQRGYSGRKIPGTSIGPPDPINDYVFEGFDTRVLEFKMVAHMTGNLGRRMKVSALAITGNGNGLAGFAVAKAPVGKTALRKAKNVAAQRLQFFERYNNHTVFHDFAVTEHKTTIFVQKKPMGYGLRCHRVIKTMCEIIGIKDIYVKTEGRTGNILNVTKAFFRGLMEQETHQKLADRMQLNVVEYRPELQNLPVPVATPSQGVSRPDPIKEEAFDFNNLYYKDGRIPLRRYKDPMAQYKHSEATWKSFINKHKFRNQKHSEFLRIVHGLQPSREELLDRHKKLK